MLHFCIGVVKPVCVVVNLNSADINYCAHVGLAHSYGSVGTSVCVCVHVCIAYVYFICVFQVYTYLNRLNVTLSYNAMLKLVSDVSKNNEVPLKKWIGESSPPNVKFIGDNVSKRVGVRDIRSDHQSHLKHMYSILVVKGRVPNPPASDQLFNPPPLSSLIVIFFQR